jgi:hypothetical protein
MSFGERRDYYGKALVLTYDEARNYYLQFAVDEGGLFCEVVHNKYLEPAYQFSGDDIAKLLELGSSRPRTMSRTCSRRSRPKPWRITW